MILQLLLLAQGIDIISVKPSDVDGSCLEEGRSCYDVSLGDDVIGHAQQDIEAASHDGEAVWKITIRRSCPDDHLRCETTSSSGRPTFSRSVL